MSRMFCRCARLALLLLAGLPALAGAQELTAGTRVRIFRVLPGKGTLTTPIARVGVVDRAAGDTLWVRYSADEPLEAVPIAEIQRLQVWQPAGRFDSALKWTWRGAIIGALAGAAFCLSEHEYCKNIAPNDTDDLSDGFRSFVVSYFVIGAVAGAAGGALFPAKEWAERQAPFALRVGMSRDGAVGFAFAIPTR